MTVNSSDSIVTSALRGLRIDRSSSVPLYHQVSRFIEKSIESGQIPNGSLLGNEVVLAERIGFSRPTMRRAMQELADKGLIVRRRGIGSRVVQPRVRRHLELSSLFDDLAKSDQTPSTTVLELARVECGDDVAEALQIPLGTEVLKMVRLRCANGKPIALMTNCLPEIAGVYSEPELLERGLYELMRDQGIRLHTASQSIGARRASTAEARLLDQARNAALLTMQRTTFDDQGCPVEFGSHLYAASRYNFEIELLAT